LATFFDLEVLTVAGLGVSGVFSIGRSGYKSFDIFTPDDHARLGTEVA
jgi:hypothetical protein